MELFEHQINGATVSVKVATSINKKGVFRFRESSGIGGNPEGVRGSEIHTKKLNKLADEFSDITGTNWKLGELVYIDSPRQYYGYITDGVDYLLYQYITTHAPGSGQQYFFSPYLSPTRVLNSNFNAKLSAWIIKTRYPKDFQKIHWQDHKNMIELIAQGVTADVMEATLVMMR